MNKQQTPAILSLFVSLPNSPLNGNSEHDALIVDMYFITLKDFDFDHVKAAAAHVLGTATFFPTPGNLRSAAIDLVVSAAGIPTAAEAWANVQDARRYIEPVYCQTGWELKHGAIEANDRHDGAEYIRLLNSSTAHERTCVPCKKGGFQEVYTHPVVAETVRRLGGREALFTDNPTSDRARFLEAYKEIVEHERVAAGRIPEVSRFIESRREEMAAALETGERKDMMRQLADGMRAS